MERISRDDLFLGMAFLTSLRSTCERKQVGAVIAMDGRPVSIGYAGSAPGTPHCLDSGCLIGPDGGCIRTQHAEANAIAWAARCGIQVKNASIYVTVSPCLPCAKLIAAAGLKEVVFDEYYRDKSGVNFLNEAKVLVFHKPFTTRPDVPEMHPVSTRQFGVFDGERVIPFGRDGGRGSSGGAGGRTGPSILRPVRKPPGSTPEGGGDIA